MKKFLNNTTNLISSYSKPPTISTGISKPKSKLCKKDNEKSEKNIKTEFQEINEYYKSLCKMDKRKEYLKGYKSN